MENMTADHPMIKVLKRFRNGQRTDVAKGTMTNSDFIVLCLYAFGPFGGPELRRLCGLWRGERYVYCGSPGEKKLDDRTLDSYFIPHYGYTATTFTSNRRYKGRFSSKPRRTYMWYRKVEHARAGVAGPRMRRYQNALTMAGIQRTEALVLLLSGHTKA